MFAARPSLEVFGDIPQFDLVAQDGQPFHSQALAGKIWVADFIYTTCPGPCPRMTSQMREVQDAVSKIPDVRLVSFTVDPAKTRRRCWRPTRKCTARRLRCGIS